MSAPGGGGGSYARRPTTTTPPPPGMSSPRGLSSQTEMLAKNNWRKLKAGRWCKNAVSSRSVHSTAPANLPTTQRHRIPPPFSLSLLFSRSTDYFTTHSNVVVAVAAVAAAATAYSMWPAVCTAERERDSERRTDFFAAVRRGCEGSAGRIATQNFRASLSGSTFLRRRPSEKCANATSGNAGRVREEKEGWGRRSE